MLVEKSSLIMYFLLNVSPSIVKVKVEQGIILGSKEYTIFNEKSYYAFYGVPYAQPPIGKLRFKDPKPLKKWTQSLDATIEYRGACAQAHIVHKQGLYGFENCLHINIYTPNLPQHEQTLKAVIVWIHGYAFTSSFSHIHGGDFLIDNDVIVITLTHRLGVYGFLKLNQTDSDANMGIKDIVMGLRWINRNVVNFGGDVKRITVMASGSAGTFISLLLATKYKKLFTKIILQSGALFSSSIFQGSHEIEKLILEKELKKMGFKDLTSATVKEVILASQKIYKSRDVMNIQRSIVPFVPMIEKQSKRSILSMNPYDDSVLRSLNFSPMPILIGFTSQESLTEVIPFIHNTNYLKLLHSHFKFMVPFEDGCNYESSSQKYKRISNVIKDWYFGQHVLDISINDFLKYVSDLRVYPIYKFIRLVISGKSEIYVYKFNYVGKFNAAKSTSLAGSKLRVKGAAQGDEICYIFKCDPFWESYVKLKENKYDADRIFMENISQMWANFAKTGSPTAIQKFDNVTWRPMSLKEDNVFLFGKRNKLITSEPERKMFEFWNKIYKKYYDSKICQRSYKDEL